MLSRVSLALFATTTFLTPLQVSLAQAQESGERTCSLVTEVNSDGAVVWSENTDIASLVAEAKSLEISAKEYTALCAGEEITQEASIESAETDEAVEEENVEDVASAEEVTEEKGEKTVMSSAGALLPLAGLGLAGGGGGGGGGSSSSSTFLDESTTYTYSASLDSTWTSRQEYKNVGHYHSASSINPYTLIGVNYAYGMGLSGSGKTIAIHDTEWKNSAGTIPYEFNGKTITYYDQANLTTGGSNSTDYHGLHVAGIIAANYNNNSSTYVSSNTNSDWSGTTPLGASMGYNGGSGDHSLLGYGMIGVAYDANLHISDFGYTTSGSYNLTSAAATNDAIGAIAQNNSWGFTDASKTINAFVTYQNNNGTSDTATYVALGGDNEANWSSYVNALNDFQASGVIVFASGNNPSEDSVGGYAGMPLVFEDLAEAWLTIGNLDVSGSTINSSSVTRYSNPCGIAAEFCVYADGTDITSTVGGYGGSSETGRYQIYDGSSMAAPMVSGSIALLSQAFPNHTPAQLTDRILASANNDFFTATGTTTFINGVTHGYNAEFGHGIVDLSMALQPIRTSSMIPPTAGFGASNTRYGNIETARRFALSSSQVKLGAAFGDSIQNSLKGRKAYFYDALNGGFAFDMGSLVKSEPITSSKRHSFDNLLGGSTIATHQRENGFSFISDKSRGDNVEGSMMAFLPVSRTTTSFIGKNIHMQNAMSFTQRGANSDYGVNSTSPFNIPFIQASEQGTSAGNQWAIGDGILSFGLFEGDEVNYGLNTTGFVADYGREIGSTHTSVFFGGTNEEDGFLATSVEGAFAETSKANTTFAGISSYGWLNSDWSYNALGSVGSTALDVEGVGLLNDVNDVTSTSFAFEMARPVGLNEHDSVHFGISQPLRVESGNATIMVPQLYDQNGTLNFSQASTDLSPSGRQLDLSFGYQAKLHDAFDVGVQFAVSKDYGHVQSKKLANSAFAFMKVAF